MLAQSLTLLTVLAVAASAVARQEVNIFRPFEGVDPNTLSCDPEGLVYLLLPGWEDCNKFYMCAHGVEVPFSCSSPELIFDFEQQSCSWPLEGKCILRTRDDEEGSGFDDGEHIINDFERTDKSAAVPAVHFSNVLQCSSSEDAARQVPYKGDCQRFWRCVSGVPQTAYCTDGLFFNAATQQCDFEGNAKCSIGVDVADELQGEFMIFE